MLAYLQFFEATCAPSSRRPSKRKARARVTDSTGNYTATVQETGRSATDCYSVDADGDGEGTPRVSGIEQLPRIGARRNRILMTPPSDCA